MNNTTTALNNIYITSPFYGQLLWRGTTCLCHSLEQPVEQRVTLPIVS